MGHQQVSKIERMEETVLDKLLQKNTFTTVRRLTVGTLLAATIPFGVTPLAMTGIVGVLLNTTVFNIERNLQKKKLLNIYQDEIAAIQHKLASELTFEDLREVSTPVEQGGKGYKLLQDEMEKCDAQRKFRLIYSTISSAITTGTLAVLMIAFPAAAASTMALVLGLGLVGLGHALVSSVVRSVGDTVFGTREHVNSVHDRVVGISDSVKLQPVAPMDVFGLFVDSNPELAKDIQNRTGKSYVDLTVMQKKSVADIYEPQLRTISLTDAINKGEIKPSLMSFIASGQVDPAMLDLDKYKKLFETPLPSISEKTFEGDMNQQAMASFTRRLLQEREDMQQGQGQKLH